MLEKNKLYLGDCLDYFPKIDDNSIDLILTDPPYNVSVEGRNISKKGMLDIRLDFGEWDIFDTDKEYFEWVEKWFSECVRVMKEGAWIYIFFDKQKIGIFDLYLAKKYNVSPRCVYVWCKTNPVPSFRKRNWLSANEFCWVGSKWCEEGKNSKIKNFLYQKDMCSYFFTPNKSSYGETEHPTEKPGNLFEHLIKVNSNEGDLVLDCFAGACTTAVACNKNNRNWICIEKDEKYYKMGSDRIEKELERNYIF